MKKVIISLISLLFTVSAQAYVMSETLVEFAKRNNPETLILGDAHYANDIAKKHFDLIKTDLIDRSKKETKTYVSLEDRPWEIKQTYTTNTLNDLVIFAREHRHKLNSVTFGSTDWRTKSIIWPLFFCGEFCGTDYTPECNGLHQKYENICDWLHSIYGNPIPTGKQVLADSRSLLKRIKQGAQKYPCAELDSCVDKMEEKLNIIVSRLEKDQHKHLNDIFYAWLQRDESATPFIEFYTHLDSFTNKIADAGFIIDFLEKKDAYDQVIFFVGHSHALSIARALQQLDNAANIKKTGKGPGGVPQGELIALHSNDVGKFLQLLPSEKRIKTATAKAGSVDILLMIVLIVVGMMLVQSVPAPRKRRTNIIRSKSLKIHRLKEVTHEKSNY